jgi:hypothetical protein
MRSLRAPADGGLRTPSVLTLLLFVMSSACAHRSNAERYPQTPIGDSLLGVIAVQGNSFDEQLVLRANGRTTRLRPRPADLATLKRLSGVEALVRGTADSTGFLVVSFTVRSVDGQPVVDGLLQRDVDRFVLETVTGARITVGVPPAAFQSLVGARVWVGGPLDRGPNVYGIIVPPPRE